MFQSHLISQSYLFAYLLVCVLMFAVYLSTYYLVVDGVLDKLRLGPDNYQLLIYLVGFNFKR